MRRRRGNLVERFARLEVIVRRVVLEVTIVVRTLAILQAFEMNLAGLSLFSLVDFFARNENRSVNPNPAVIFEQIQTNHI